MPFSLQIFIQLYRFVLNLRVFYPYFSDSPRSSIITIPLYTYYLLVNCSTFLLLTKLFVVSCIGNIRNSGIISTKLLPCVEVIAAQLIDQKINDSVVVSISVSVMVVI